MFFKSKSQGAAAVADNDGGTAIAPVFETVIDTSPPSKKKKANKHDDDLEYEWEFDTPFAKLEFEVEPKDRHAEKEQKRREKAEADAAKKAARIAKLAAKEAEKRGIVGPVVIVKRSNLVPALVIFTIVVAAVGIAIWLFARPGEDEDEIPAELRKDGAAAAADAVPPSLAGRLKNAVRAGKKASREAQDEQQRRFEEMSKQG